jgi:hypothetical protein
MKKADQKEIAKQLKLIQDADLIIKNAIASIQSMHDAMESDYDSKTEKWQEGENGEKAHAQIDGLSTAIGQLESAESDVESAISEFEDILNNLE